MSPDDALILGDNRAIVLFCEFPDFRIVCGAEADIEDVNGFEPGRTKPLRSFGGRFSSTMRNVFEVISRLHRPNQATLGI